MTRCAPPSRASVAAPRLLPLLDGEERDRGDLIAVARRLRDERAQRAQVPLHVRWHFLAGDSGQAADEARRALEVHVEEAGGLVTEIRAVLGLVECPAVA